MPAGTSKFFLENFEKLPQSERQPYLIHTVAKGEDIISISEKYDVAIDDFVAINNLNQKTIALSSGSSLRIPIGGKNYAQSTLMYTTSGLQPKTEVLTNNPNYHIVSVGESVYSVAAKYKISTVNLRNWNKLHIDEELLPEGATLIISASEAAKQTGAAATTAISTTQSSKTASNTGKNEKALPNEDTYVVQAGDNLSKIALNLNFY